MRVLVTWASKLGGTEGIARIVAEELEFQGFEVTCQPADDVRRISGFDAAIIGGALYSLRWHKAARRVISRNIHVLRRMPVWLFSSGPLDASADTGSMPPVKDVAVLMDRVGALGHATFGGRLAADAKGFPVSAMARKHAGDWRNPTRVHAWAAEIAATLPTVQPGVAREPAAHSLGRLLLFAAVGWAVCALIMGGLLAVAPMWLALTLHAIAAPVVVVPLSYLYFRAPGAREPLETALTFTVVIVILDAVVVAGLAMRSAEMFLSVAGTWLPLALIFLSTWATGEVVAMRPQQRLAGR